MHCIRQLNILSLKGELIGVSRCVPNPNDGNKFIFYSIENEEPSNNLDPDGFII